MFIQDRDSSRRFFLDIWQKYQQKKALEPLEQIVLEVILGHSEYHNILDDPEQALSEEFTPESGASNPFLHMGMHIAIREQVGADRPAGIRKLYQSLLIKFSDSQALEHAMMECLGEVLWNAQRNNLLPDENHYLERLKRLG